MLSYVIKRILRRPFVSLGSLVLACALCLALCFLVQYRSRQAAQLEEIRDSYQILCTVTDARGVNTESLRLAKRYVEFIEDEEEGLGAYIKDLKITRELMVEYVDYWQTDVSGFIDTPYRVALGLSDPACSALTDPARGGAYHLDTEDFFHSEEALCLVPETDYEGLRDKTLCCVLSSPYTKEGAYSSAAYDLRVAGYYRGPGNVLLIPYEFAQNAGYEIDDTRSVDSISFVLKDNTKSEEMRNKAMEHFTVPAPSSFSGRAGLVIKDHVYRMTMGEMEQNVKQADRLIPVSLALSLAAGFLAAYIGVRGESRTYALMRTLGLGAGRLGVQVLAEQLLLPALGILLAGLSLGQMKPALLFLGCYGLGCLLAVLRPVLARPTKLLRSQE